MSKKVTRRDFLKGSLAGAAALTLTSLGGVGVQAEAAGLNSRDRAENRAFSPTLTTTRLRTRLRS